MHVIRHDYVASDSPSMPFARCTPFLDENLRCTIVRKSGPAIFRAGRNKINRRIKPDALESPQMFMHRLRCS